MAYSDEVNADARQWTSMVEVFFDGIENSPTVIEQDVVTTISLLEEATAQNVNPLGTVSANEVNLGFDNSNRNFTLSNTASPYYGKMKPNVVVKPYLGLVLANSSIEYVPLGVFKTGDWSAKGDVVEATVTAYDRLYGLKEMNCPDLAVMEDTTVAGLFAALFQALGLGESDYYIDPSLTQPIKAGFVPKGTVNPALQALSVAGYCHVYVDRQNVIQVRGRQTFNSTERTWTDDNQIITAQNPQQYLDVYSSVRIKYKLPSIKADQTLVQISNLVVPVEGLTVEVEFTSGPVSKVSEVMLLNSINTRLYDIQYGAWKLTVSINNSGEAPETVNLKAVGSTVELTASEYRAVDSSAEAEFGVKELVIDNDLIQNEDVAIAYANAILPHITDPYANFELSVRGDPAVLLHDTLVINDPSEMIAATTVAITRTQLKYDGGLEAEVSAVRV